MMTQPTTGEILVGNAPLSQKNNQVEGDYRCIDGEKYYQICNYDQMPPFFMSIVSSADHWMFISSTGGLSAGRVNAESSLFPYYTDDKLAENSDNTGHLAIFLVEDGNRQVRWQPFSDQYAGLYAIGRNLYKNVTGDKLIFEEINFDLQLTYRYAWRSSKQYGWVKTSWLQNSGPSTRTITLLDGLQNVLPYGATVALQTTLSNLLNGYKRSELEPETGLGIFALSATLTDLAEPSESLKATTVWQCGLDNAQLLLSTNQVAAFKRGYAVTQKTEVRGYRGAYLANTTLDLASQTTQSWHFVAEVNQDHGTLAALLNLLRDESADLPALLEADIEAGNQALEAIVANADGLQFSADTLTANHHFANVLFNTMRGGIFADNYQVRKDDLIDFFNQRNRPVLAACGQLLDRLADEFNYRELLALAAGSGSADFIRLVYEYMPLTFSRRHGDPSRPWNIFSINITKPDGSQRLDYQGNWRDIFQNWEPLAYSYPDFVESMISKFLNATTADGYNPYRVTRNGIEWESPAPDDPWANIGYWSDHQIVYLERLLDISRRFHPGKLEAILHEKIFSHANVPYRIKPYSAILEDAYNTIDFDWDVDSAVHERVAQMGSDGKLVADADGNIVHSNLAEKMLLLLLAKLGNLIPEGGIWMITQRPEWNDANNALVGKGMSVVTLCHLRRYIQFFSDLLERSDAPTLEISSELASLFGQLAQIFDEHQAPLASAFTEAQRRAMMDALGQASSDYRWAYYENGLSGQFAQLETGRVVDFLALAQRYIDHSLRANRRADGMYHAYNVLDKRNGRAAISYLYEMLEGQVAILSTGLLSGAESLALLQSMRDSRLYDAQQHSYLLYPNRDLPTFLTKNCVPAETAAQSKLIQALSADRNFDLISADVNGIFHFNATFRNANGVRDALGQLAQDDRYADLVASESTQILDLFEQVFNHNAFTGRSGTFFAFEGLGSIYWHQVSKLLLATQETVTRAIAAQEDAQLVNALVEAYYDIRAGIGFNKAPDVYGAFPTDPYSHTPAGQGAKQPGMTGQVKEEIMTRFAELGITIEAGELSFAPQFLRASEFSQQPAQFSYVALDGQKRTIGVPANGLAFTLCQVPVVYQLCDGGVVQGSTAQIELIDTSGAATVIDGTQLDAETSAKIFGRTNTIQQLNVTLALM